MAQFDIKQIEEVDVGCSAAGASIAAGAARVGDEGWHGRSMGARSSVCWRDVGLVWCWVGEGDLGWGFAVHGSWHGALWGATVGLSGRHDEGGEDEK